MAAAIAVIMVLASTLPVLPSGAPQPPDLRCPVLSEWTRRAALQRFDRASMSLSVAQSLGQESVGISCGPAGAVRAISRGFAAAALDSGIPVRWSVEGRVRHCEARLLSQCLPQPDPSGPPVSACRRSLLYLVWFEVRQAIAAWLEWGMAIDSFDGAIESANGPWKRRMAARRWEDIGAVRGELTSCLRGQDGGPRF